MQCFDGVLLLFFSDWCTHNLKHVLSTGDVIFLLQQDRVDTRGRCKMRPRGMGVGKGGHKFSHSLLNLISKRKALFHRKFLSSLLLILTQIQPNSCAYSNTIPKSNPNPNVNLNLNPLKKQMKKARMNISYFRFTLFDLKIFGEIVTTFQKFFHF